MVNALTEALEAEVPTEPVVKVDDTKDYLSELVGAGKKYETAQLLAKSYVHADLHIRELTEELHEERKKRLEDQKTLQEVVAELRKSPEPSAVTPSNQSDGAVKPTEVNEETVVKAVDRALSDRESKKFAEENTDKALIMLTKHYGTKQKALEAVAKTINKSDKMRKIVNELAATNPNAAFTMITGEQLKAPDQVNTPGLGSAESPAANLSPRPHELTWSYCQKLRKEKPLEYKSVGFRSKIEAAILAYQAKGLDFYKT